MSRTVTRNDRQARDGFIVYREPKPEPRRRGTRDAIIRAELATDRPAVRAALKGARA